MYLLGYIPKDNRLYLGDKELNIVSYSLLVSVLEYQTAVMRRDFSMADKVLPTIPKEQRTRVAHFLEKQVRGVVCLFMCVFKASSLKECLYEFELYFLIVTVIVSLWQWTFSYKFKSLINMLPSPFSLSFISPLYVEGDLLVFPFCNFSSILSVFSFLCCIFLYPS